MTTVQLPRILCVRLAVLSWALFLAGLYTCTVPIAAAESPSVPAPSLSASVRGMAAHDATSGGALGDSDSCRNANLKNSAFVFVKPHANTPATRQLVRQKLAEAGVDVLSETEISGEEIDRKKLIDRHYFAIASKATLLNAEDIPVPPDKFLQAFGESWTRVLQENRACNALQACRYFDCTADELNDAWQACEDVVKLGGGFYCGRMSMNGRPSRYVFNAFFMSMRSKFVGTNTSVYCYTVEWDPSDLPWSSFRNNLLGPTDPSAAPTGSIRRTIFERYRSLGLRTQPTKSDNGVHASASPFEGLAEKRNWLETDIEHDPFGRALIENGIPKETLLEWSLDPQIPVSDTERGSVFDALEDMDVYDCIDKLVQLYERSS